MDLFQQLKKRLSLKLLMIFTLSFIFMITGCSKKITYREKESLTGAQVDQSGPTEDLASTDPTPTTQAIMFSLVSLNTSDTTPGLSGTIGDLDAAIKLTIDGDTYNARNNGDGTWSLLDNIVHNLVEGSHDVEVTLIPASGPTTAQTISNAITIISPDALADYSGTIHELTFSNFGTSIPISSGFQGWGHTVNRPSVQSAETKLTNGVFRIINL